MTEHARSKASRTDVLVALIRIVEAEIDWDIKLLEPISRDTYLIGDLDYDSVAVVLLLNAIEAGFSRPNLPFEELLTVDDAIVDDLSVGEIADFLHEHLNGVHE
jgi:acyl carrier protein